MKSLYFFGNYFNGLEFVTYIIIPLSVILIILFYLAINWKAIMIYFFSECCVLENIDKSLNNQYIHLQEKLNCYNDNE